MNGSQAPQPVTVSLEQLQQGTIPFESLEAAFGPTSLGIIVVKGLPQRFLQLRQSLLQHASYLAHLPSETLSIVPVRLQTPMRALYAKGLPLSTGSLTREEAKYLVGWSHGKETLKPGVYDTLKGSYYVNCAFYQDSSLAAAPVTSEFPNFPEYTAPNVWPADAALPGFRETFEELCTLVIDTAVLVARACDRYAAAHIEDYQAGYLERVVSTSMTTKARLLHYFPPAYTPPSLSSTRNGGPVASPAAASIAVDDDDDDSWCATHLDHGCLTGLTSALYIDETAGLPTMTTTQSLPELVTFAASPDPAAGLYIRSRTGETTKVGFPAECLAFQTGESLERITRGKFRAVPHFVRGPGKGIGQGVARNTLAVFTQPNLGEMVDVERGTTFANFAGEVISRNT